MCHTCGTEKEIFHKIAGQALFFTRKSPRFNGLRVPNAQWDKAGTRLGHFTRTPPSLGEVVDLAPRKDWPQSSTDRVY